jgi:hypothetical protein
MENNKQKALWAAAALTALAAVYWLYTSSMNQTRKTAAI